MDLALTFRGRPDRALLTRSAELRQDRDGPL
jgi:hypothetical protein